MAEFSVSGNDYVATTIDTVTAFAITCKLAVLIETVAEILPSLRKKLGEQLAKEQEREMLRAQGLPVPESSDDFTGLDPKLLGSFGRALSSLPDDHRTYILAQTLGVVMRRQGSGALPIWNRATEKLNFPDIDMLDMLTIMYHVFEENLASFMKAAPALNNLRKMGG